MMTGTDLDPEMEILEAWRLEPLCTRTGGGPPTERSG